MAVSIGPSGLTLNNGTISNHGVKQHIVISPNPGVIAKSGGWSEVSTLLRPSITPVSSASSLIVTFDFVFGGNNSSVLAAFKVRDITNGFDINMSNNGNRSASHGTSRHRDHDVNDCEMITVTAYVPNSQLANTNARTYALYFKNENNNGTTKYFFGWGQNLTQGFYAKPVATIVEV